MSEIAHSSESHGNDSKEIAKKFNTKLTLNHYGMMFPMEHPHFVQMKSLMDKSKPVADLGVAFGYTSLKLLESGFQKVYANDLDERHLSELWNNTPEQFKSKLELKPGNVLDLNFEKGSLGGLVAIKVLHFLTPEDFRSMLKRIYEWLAPNGYLMITSPSPCFFELITPDNVENIKNVFYERVKNKDEWPGIFESSFLFKHNESLRRNIDSKQNLFSNEVLMREAALAGFEVLKCEYFGLNLKDLFYINDCTLRHEASIICFKR